eukprot:12413975-Karenia_brevis.AAC.1
MMMITMMDDDSCDACLYFQIYRSDKGKMKLIRLQPTVNGKLKCLSHAPASPPRTIENCVK